jgi:hypothetical protein
MKPALNLALFAALSCSPQQGHAQQDEPIYLRCAGSETSKEVPAVQQFEDVIRVTEDGFAYWNPTGHRFVDNCGRNAMQCTTDVTESRIDHTRVRSASVNLRATEMKIRIDRYSGEYFSSFRYQQPSTTEKPISTSSGTCVKVADPAIRDRKF